MNAKAHEASGDGHMTATAAELSGKKLALTIDVCLVTPLWRRAVRGTFLIRTTRIVP